MQWCIRKCKETEGYYANNIVTNNVKDIVKLLTRFQERNEKFELSPCKGINGEDLINIRFAWTEYHDEEDN